MQMGGRVPISNDFIMLLPRVIGDFVSTIGGTMDVCRDNGYRACLPNGGKFRGRRNGTRIIFIFRREIDRFPITSLVFRIIIFKRTCSIAIKNDRETIKKKEIFEKERTNSIPVEMRKVKRQF